jgi:excisionase family DNA binding protein
VKARQLYPLKEVTEHRPWATERKLRRLVAEHRIPYHKVGASVLIDLEDVDALAEAGRVEAV